MKRILSLLTLVSLSWGVQAQNILDFPFHENFESSNWTSVYNHYGTSGRDSNWTQVDSLDYTWQTQKGNDQLFQTGPDFDYTIGGGHYLNTAGNSTDTSASISSPWVDLSSAVQPELTFANYRYGSGITKLVVWVQTYNSTSWDTLQTYYGSSQPDATSAWQISTSDLSSYSGDTIRVKFEADGNDINRRTVAIDNIAIAEGDTCNLPFGLYRSSSTQTSITVGWTNPAADSTFIRYVKRGEPLSNAQIVGVGSAANSRTINGLSPGNYYTIWLTNSCVKNGSERWSAYREFTTSCGQVTLPVVEDFNGAEWTLATTTSLKGTVHPCWARWGSPSKVWQPTASNSNMLKSVSPPPSGSNKWVQYGGHDNAANYTTYLASPSIQKHSSATTYISFWYRHDGDDIQSIRIGYTTGGSPTVFHTISLPATNEYSVWRRAVFAIPASVPNISYYTFQAYAPSTSSPNEAILAIDDLQFTTTPPCEINFSINPIGAGSDSVNFTTNVTRNLIVQYGESGFKLGEGTEKTVSGSGFSINSLQPTTDYDVYINYRCSGEDNWLGPITVRTACLPTTLPYSIDFEEPEFITPSSFTPSVGNSNYPECWNSGDATSDFYFTLTSALKHNGTSADHTTGLGQYASVYHASTNSGNRDASLTTPAVNLTTSTHPELSFWYKYGGKSATSFNVVIDGTTSNSTEFSLTNASHYSLNDEWKKAVIDLSAYSGRNITVSFNINATASTGAMGPSDALLLIDDILIRERPSCPEPINVQASSSYQDSITVSWDDRGATQWIVEYGPVGFTPGSGDTLLVTGSPNTVIHNLENTTRYHFYVHTVCSSTTIPSSTPAVGSVACSAIQAPFYTNFEDENWHGLSQYGNNYRYAKCWFATHGTIGTDKMQSFSGTFPGDHTNGSGQYWASQYYFLLPRSLRTPELDLSQLTSPELRFWSYFYHENSGDTAYVIVTEVSSNTQTFIPIAPASAGSGFWKETVIDLSSFKNSNIQITWRVSDRGYFGIDDISIDEKSQCGIPANLTASPFYSNAVELNWDTDSLTQWEIIYAPKSAGLQNGTTVLSNGSPTVIKGLDANVEYAFKVRSRCSTNSYSSWSQEAYATPNDSNCLYRLALCMDQLSLVNKSVRVYFDGDPQNGKDYYWSTDSVTNHYISIPAGTNFSLRFNGIVTGVYTDDYGIILEDPSGTPLYSRLFQTSAQAGILDTSTLVSGTGQSCNNICSGIVNPSIHSIGITSATISWASSSDSSQVWVSSNSSAPMPNTPFYASSLVLDTLLPNTLYYVHLGDTCTGGYWYGPLLFTTLDCDSIDTRFTFNNTWDRFQFNTVKTDNSSIDSMYWDFGDGTFSTVENPNHNYANPGTYDVKLKLIDVCGNLDSSSQTIQVCDTIFVNFTHQLTGNTMQFTPQVNTNTTASYEWNFGDGNTSSLASPNHTYTSLGFYTVSLKVVDSCGNADSISTYIEACNPPLPTYTVTANGFSATFDASATQNSSSLVWNIDGTVYNTTTASHTFPGYGRYRIRLTTRNACNTRIDSVFYYSICVAPEARATTNILSQTTTALEMEFSAVPSVAESYYWDFGDGTTGDSIVEHHTYTTPYITYTVTLVTFNACGESDTTVFPVKWVSISELNATQLTLYPNPTSGNISIETDLVSLSDATLSLVTTDGKLVSENLNYESRSDHHITLDIHQPPGEYILIIQTSSGSISKPIIIAR